jgi:hypothetical protein
VLQARGFWTRESDFFEASGCVLVQKARDQRLIRQTLRERPLLNRFQILARQADVQPSVFLERRLCVAREARSFTLTATDRLPLARSTDSSNSFSSATIFMVGPLTEVLLRGLPPTPAFTVAQRVPTRHTLASAPFARTSSSAQKEDFFACPQRPQRVSQVTEPERLPQSDIDTPSFSS